MYSDDSEDAFDVFGSDDNVPDQGLNHTVDSSHPSSSLSCSTTLAAALPAAHDTAAHTPSASDSTTRPSRVTHTHDKPRLISTPHSRHASLSPSSSASGTLIHSSTLPSAVAEAAAVGDAHSHTSQACAAGISDNAADRTPITPLTTTLTPTTATMTTPMRTNPISAHRTHHTAPAAGFTLLTGSSSTMTTNTSDNDANASRSAASSSSSAAIRESCSGIAIRHCTASLAPLPVWMSIRPYVDVRDSVHCLRRAGGGVVERTIVGVVLRRGDPKQSQKCVHRASYSSSSGGGGGGAYAVFAVWSMKGLPPCAAEELSFVLCGHAFAAYFTQLVCGTVVAIGPLTPMSSSSSSSSSSTARDGVSRSSNQDSRAHRNVDTTSPSSTSPMLRLSDSEHIRILGHAVDLIACAGHAAHTQTRCSVLVNAAQSPYCARHVSQLRRVALGKTSLPTHAASSNAVLAQSGSHSSGTLTRFSGAQARVSLPPSVQTPTPLLPTLQNRKTSWSALSASSPPSSCGGVTRAHGFLTVRGGVGSGTPPMVSSSLYSSSSVSTSFPAASRCARQQNGPNDTSPLNGMSASLPSSSSSSSRLLPQHAASLSSRPVEYPSVRVLGVTGRGAAVLQAAQLAEEKAREVQLLRQLSQPHAAMSNEAVRSSRVGVAQSGADRSAMASSKRLRELPSLSSLVQTEPPPPCTSQRQGMRMAGSRIDKNDAELNRETKRTRFDESGAHSGTRHHTTEPGDVMWLAKQSSLPTDALCQAIQQTYAPVPPAHAPSSSFTPLTRRLGDATSASASSVVRSIASSSSLSRSTRTKSALVSRVSRVLDAERRAHSRHTDVNTATNNDLCPPSSASSSFCSTLATSSFLAPPSSSPSSSRAPATTRASPVSLCEVAHEMKSAHEALRQEASVAQINAYLDKHTAQEKAQEVLQSITESATRAVFCHDCQQWYSRVTQSCTTHGHRTEIKDTVRRYVRCEHCTYTTFVLGESVQPWRMLPRCPRCGARTVWERGNALRSAGVAHRHSDAEDVCRSDL